MMVELQMYLWVLAYGKEFKLSFGGPNLIRPIRSNALTKTQKSPPKPNNNNNNKPQTIKKPQQQQQKNPNTPKEPNPQARKQS